jgi:hypothetical protein
MSCFFDALAYLSSAFNLADSSHAKSLKHYCEINVGYVSVAYNGGQLFTSTLFYILFTSEDFFCDYIRNSNDLMPWYVVTKSVI